MGMMPDEESNRVLRYDMVWVGEKYDFVDINTSFDDRWGYAGRSGPGIVIWDAVRSRSSTFNRAVAYDDRNVSSVLRSRALAVSQARGSFGQRRSLCKL